MILFEVVNVQKPKINYTKTKKWLSNISKEYNKTIKNIAIVFCDDNYLLELNKKYLNHDYFTDILTFNYSEKKNISADLIISIETVKFNANKYKTEFKEELRRVIIHGFLHLFGYEDYTQEQKKIMTQKENYYLKKQI